MHGILLVTSLLSGIILTVLYPARDFSAASGSRHGTMQTLVWAHLVAGVLAGFGIGLLVWPVRFTDS